MFSIPEPNRELAGVIICDTPLVRKALEFAKVNVDEFTYHHVVRSLIYGSALLPLSASAGSESFDHEAFAIATILHDLGWNLSAHFTSKDKRFEVDGANAARDFLVRETEGWDSHRLQLVWDAIALHTTPSIARHKEPVVAAVVLGITADICGPDVVPGGILTTETFHRVADKFARANFKEGVRDMMCQICLFKPETTYDNFVGEFGQKYVEGYSREGKLVLDLMESTP
jgi:hypothetical protein